MECLLAIHPSPRVAPFSRESKRREMKPDITMLWWSLGASVDVLCTQHIQQRLLGKGRGVEEHFWFTLAHFRKRFLRRLCFILLFGPPKP